MLVVAVDACPSQAQMVLRSTLERSKWQAQVWRLSRARDRRHTVASQAVARGVPLPTVARMLGHADPKMTLRYAHVNDRDLQPAAERTGKAIEAAMGLSAQLPTLDTLSGGSSG